MGGGEREWITFRLYRHCAFPVSLLLRFLVDTVNIVNFGDKFNDLT